MPSSDLTEPMGRSAIMVIVVLPSGYTVSDVRPRPIGARSFQERVAVFWSIQAREGSRADLEWTVSGFHGPVAEQVAQINRELVAGPPAQDGQLQSLARVDKQLQEARENLRLIEERKDQYVLEVDIPPQLIKEERRLRKRIEELEQQIGTEVRL